MAEHPDIEVILLDEQDIMTSSRRWGAESRVATRIRNPWSLLFFAELLYSWPTSCAATECPLSIDFMVVSSYGDGKSSASCAL